MNGAEPNSKQLVSQALRGLEMSRTPTGPLAVHFCARVSGISLREYTTNPRLLAEAVIRYYERFRPDGVWLSSDTWVSAQAMGASVGATNDCQPFGSLGEPLIRSGADINRIPAPNVNTQGRYPLMLEALARICDMLSKEAFVVACFDQYPFSLASALMGLDKIMLKLTDDPPMVEALMERCLEYGLAYGNALSSTGADMLSGGDSPAGLVGPRSYRELALPYERRLIAGLNSWTRKPVSLHICGNAAPILPDMVSSGADVLEIDHQVDLANACRIVGPDIGLWGNLDPVALLMQGSTDQIRQASREAAETVRACGHKRFVLSSGCTIAPDTPFENVDAMLRSTG
jgi:MtaA/CmuA family methyltransferase